jgi:hypothetical protein
MRDRYRRWGWSGLVLLATALAAACENPASPGRHLRAYGVAVQDGAAELVRATGITVRGGLTVSSGQQRGPLTVLVLDRNGQPLDLPAGYWLQVVSSAPATARWFATSEGAFTGRLEGVTPGTAVLQFCLWHGAIGRGHEDGCQDVLVSVHAT